MTNNEKKLIDLCEEMIDLNHIENGFKDFPELSRIKRELATLRAEAEKANPLITRPTVEMSKEYQKFGPLRVGEREDWGVMSTDRIIEFKMRWIAEHSEEIVTAFLAKYGCGPDDVVMCQTQDGRSFIRMKNERERAGDWSV